MALKTEAIGLAIAVELPLVIVDIQRGGPSTGLPTKTEQADLLQAIFGRNSEAPLPVLAAATPGDCFWIALEACRIAIKYMMPVIVLSDGYLANGAEPWRIPDVERPARVPGQVPTDPEGFQPYLRDPDDPGAALGRARHAGPRAPHRRPREAGRHRQRQLRAVEPRARWSTCAPPRWRRSSHDVPDVVPAGDPEGDLLHRRLGLDLRSDHRRAPRTRASARAARSATCTCAI